MDVLRVPPPGRGRADGRELTEPLDRRLLHRARGARVLLGVDVALGIVGAVLVLSQATVLASIVAKSFDGATLAEVTTLLLVLAALFLARGALAWAFEVAGRRGAVDVLSELRSDVVGSVLRRGASGGERVESAEIAAVAVHGLEPLEIYFGRFLPQMVLAVVVPVAVLLWVVQVDALSAGVMLLTLPLVPVFMVLVGRYTERQTRARAQALALLAARFLDTVRGLPTLRAFNRSAAQRAAIAEAGEQYRVATMKTLRVAFLSGAVLELAATLGIALVAVTVGVRLVDGGLGFRAGLTVLLLAPELYLPLRSLAAQYHASADGVAVAERLLQHVAEGDTSIDTATTPSGSVLDNGALVRLTDVSFAYPGRGAPVLDGVDLELRSGETLGLVGPSGTGKSTLASLVLGLAQPTSGSVERADCPVAWVPQRATIFRGTFADNIRLADPQADDERVRAAARAAGVERFVDELPDGFETIVGDGGRPLSAGEQRRIALARAFLRDAPLVVLDEPTANLDARNAAAVGEAVDGLLRGRAVLLIAHRPELVNRADRVVLLEGGRLREIRAGAGT